MGDILRDEVKNGTAAGKKAKDFMDRGVLVPDEVVVEMVKTRLAQDDVKAHGWLLDGYPRSASQAEAIEKESIRPDLFLLIQVQLSPLSGGTKRGCRDAARFFPYQANGHLAIGISPLVPPSVPRGDMHSC